MTINRAGRIAPLLAFLLFADLTIDPILASLVCPQTYFLVGHELFLQGLAGRLFVLDDCTFEVQELRWHGENREVCSWWGGIALPEELRNTSREGSLREVELEHSGASGGKERVVLPEGVRWDAVHTLQLRCPWHLGPKAWAEVPHGSERGGGIAAQRRLLQSGEAPALLSTYPGQDSASASPDQGSGEGQPQPLFPPPPGPPRTSADASQQRLQFSPSAEAAAFSAVDLSGGPSVTVVDNSPGLPSLGAYPGAATDLTLTAPPAFPDFSPSPEAAAASSPPLGQGTPANAAAASPPLVTPAAAVAAAAPQGATAAVPATVAAASPPAQAAASPPVAAATPPVTPLEAAVPPTQATPVPTPAPTPAATAAAASSTPAAAPAAATRQASPVEPPVQPPVQAPVPPAVVPAPPTPAATPPTPLPSDAEEVASALSQLPPGALAPAIGQNLSALASDTGQDLSNVGGQNLTALGGSNVGELAGSVLGGGNALAPAPSPTATQLINSVVPPSAALPLAGQTPSSEAAAPVPAPAVAASPAQAPASASDLSDAAAAAAALEALTNQANAPSQSTDAALAAALAAAATPPAAVSQPAAAPRPVAPVAAPETAAAAPPRGAAAPGPSGNPAGQPTAPPVPAPAGASQSTSAASQDLGSEAASAPTQAQADYDAALAAVQAAASPSPPAGAPALGPGNYDASLAAALAAANAAPPAAAPRPFAPAPAPVPAAAAPSLSTADAAAAAAAALVAAGLAPPGDQQALLAAIAGILVRAPVPAPSIATAPEASRTVPSSVALAPSFYANIAGDGGPSASPSSAPALAPGSSGLLPSSLALAPSIYRSAVGGGGQTASPAPTPAPAPGSSNTGAPVPAPIAAVPGYSPGITSSDADLASAAIAALYAPPPVATPQLAPAPSAAFPPIPAAAPAPAPARDFRVASSSLSEAPAAAPAQQPLPYAPPPLGNVTLTFQPPAAPAEDLGGYPGEFTAPPAMQALAPGPSAAAGPAEALAAPAPAPELSIPEALGGGARRPSRSSAQAASPGAAPQLAPAPGVALEGVPSPAPASAGAPAAAPEAAAAAPAPAAAPSQLLTLAPAAAPLLASAPSLAAPSAGRSSAPVAAPGFAAAPGAVPASSLMMAPAPGPAGQPVVNLALTLNGPGLTDLLPAGKAAIQQALAKQLNLAPEQITVLGSRPAGPFPTRRRTMLQQPAQSNQSSVVDVQIRPAADQAAGVLSAISQSNFPAAIKDQLTSAGLPVQSAGVAAVSQSFAPTSPSTPQPTPAPKDNSAADAALEAWNDKMAKIHGWLMFSAFIIFLPLAILTAFAFKDWQPFWFYIHITAVVLALVTAAAGLVVGFALIIDDYKQIIHKWAGLAIVAGLLLQVLSAFLVRPPPDSRFRKYWNTTHFWWGRILAVVALLNFFFGLFLVHSSPLYYIVPGAILLAWLLVGLVKKLFSSMRPGSGQNRENKATADSLRMDYHMRGNNNASRKPIQELYSSPLPGNNGANLHTRPSYLGGGNAAYGNPHSGGSGIQMSSAVGNGYGIAGAPAAVERGGSGGAPGVPKSAFAAAGQVDRGEWDDDEGEPVRNGGGASSSNLPRQPLHPLPSHGSFTAQLPPRPSELLKEGKVGAGEQIIARRRNRRLVPEGVPLNSRLSGALSGNLDANIGKRAAEAYKPRPRPSRLLSTPPEEMFRDEDEDYSPPPLRSRPAAAATAVRTNGAGQDNGAEVSPPDSNRSADENDLPPAVKARINSYYK